MLLRFFTLLFMLLLNQQLFAAAKPIPKAPEIAASSYILMDFKSGKILAEKTPDKRVEPASITKLMTAYLVDKALEAGDISLTDEVTISEKAWRMKGSKMFVEVGKKVSVEKLIEGMIIQSGNDATVALAEHVAGTEKAFAEYMNHQAKLLGMNNTQFKNSTGWPHKDHFSTARDIAILSQAIIRDYPESYRLYSVKEYTFNEIRQFNRNRLLWRDSSVDGLKTGHTEAAGYCLASSAEKDNMRLISVVLGTKSDKARTRNSQTLLNYGFRFYESNRLYQAKEALKTSKVWYGEQDQVSLGVQQDVFVTIARGRYKELDASVEIDPKISAPVALGQELGRLVVKLDGVVIVAEPLVAMQAINDGGLVKKAIDSIKILFE
ncbi:MAG: D-alanyl-D-alanine carboxypeptidase [Gammaproteobacteria bacterium]|jgi:serine-type D-Ala-D-Ala carboxypeptidase (penicillin-binding protein 5/6)|nr:D-alanyl-D-alanine carboxypeptidase [Gammaproteobacteria bacterium]MBT3722924.1 D-alanyl-D-alanine carboxypeptidase [Gammaproteobacteria bacterium]MBT4075263.1 D-alanyl-D-alanine carboxypeptidase [Gammaproteobacteria bacterium]MBT4193418.1 D-alanyl-D-alanine carboxypeptidase [Gammaproteobacteria bacterium]MBT4449041.1 D-alanyl-D-alanine carboxypeptidase [Gammaproteobacteria bacterium]